MEEIIEKTKRTLIEVGEALGIRNLDPDPGVIFVTGGSGVVGHRVASSLLTAGYSSVRVGSQHAENVKDLKKLGAQVVDFCWEREETYAPALTGVKSVLCSIPYTAKWQTHFAAFLEACSMAGVKHFIKISFYHATANDDFQEVPLVRKHGNCDELLIKFVHPDNTMVPIMGGDADIVGFDLGDENLCPNMSYSILYASHFMSNPFYFQGRELRRNDPDKPSTYFGASCYQKINYVSPNDVAEMAMRILLAPKEHYNKEYTLTGPEPIQDQQVAELLSKYLQKPIAYEDQPFQKFEREMQAIGEPQWMLEDLVSLEKLKASGVEERSSFVSPDIEKICGRPPESFEDYLRKTDRMTPIESGTSAPFK